MTPWSDWATQQLTQLQHTQRYRRCLPFDAQGPRGSIGAQSLLSFASNDYLGLSQHPDVCAAAQQAIAQWGTGASASRLVTGTRSLHQTLEEELARSYGAPRALVFSSGFAANLGVMTALGSAEVTFFSDQLNHASLIDGMRLAKASTAVYRHCDVDHLRQLLSEVSGRKIIVTETVFSMDGDLAPLAQIAELAVQHGALLVIDQAHDVWDSASELHQPELELLRIGTLSKTLGSLGGWAAGNTPLIEWLINRARSFIYTTGLTPADAAAALAALRICRSEIGAQLRAQLRSRIDALRPGHPSPILPIILGAEEAALAAAARLFEQGIYVPAIRPPTVAPQTSRLRVALSALHTDDMLDQLQRALHVAGVSL